MRLIPAKHVGGSLARQDPMAPVRAAASTAKGFTALITGANDFAEDYLEAEDATNVAQMSAEYKKRSAILQQKLEGSPVIGYNDNLVTDEMRDLWGGPKIDDYGVDIAEQPEYIETHKVMQEIYDRETKRYEDFALSNIQTRKGRDDFYKFISNQRATGAANIVSQSLKWRRASMSVTADMAAQTAVSLTDPVEANQSLLRVAEVAFSKGVWGYEKFHKTVTEGQANIEYSHWDRQIRAAPTMDALETLDLELGSIPTLMKPQDVRKLRDEIDKRQDDIDTTFHKDMKNRREETSGSLRSTALMEMTTTLTPLSKNRLRELTAGMEPSDLSVVLSVQRTLSKEKKEGTFKSNPTAMLQAGQAVNDLLSYSDEPMAERRAAAMTRIYDIAKINPETGEVFGPLVISWRDLNTLVDRVHKAQGMVYDNELVKQTVDQIYGLLTKGAKSSRNNPNRSVDHFSYRLAVEAEGALLTAAGNGGESFDPAAWWQANKVDYITQTMQKNIDAIGKEFGKGIIVYGTINDAATIDLAATLKAARAGYRSELRVRQIMDYAAGARRLKLEKDAVHAEEDRKAKSR